MWKVRFLPEFQRLKVGRCIFCQSNLLNSSASSVVVPGLATDPFSILRRPRRSTQVISPSNCLSSSLGTRVIQTGRFSSVQVTPYGSEIEGTLMELFHESIEVVVPRETSCASGTGKTPTSVFFHHNG